MSFAHTVGARRFTFADLRTLMACATPLRSGDRLAGVAAADAQERVAAQMALADLPLAAFLNQAVVPYEDDAVTRLIIDSHDMAAFAPVAALTVGGLRDWLLGDAADAATLGALAPGLTPEMVAAVSKICRLQDLVLVARKCSVVTRFRSTIGLPGRLATRLQPNHPTDDAAGIAASLLDGLLHGSGDAVIGINPATDNVGQVTRLLHMLDEVISRYAIPTQSCVLTHVTNTLQAIERGAPVDLVFQSIGGTEGTNRSFGIDLALLAEARAAALSLRRGHAFDDLTPAAPGRSEAAGVPPRGVAAGSPAAGGFSAAAGVFPRGVAAGSPAAGGSSAAAGVPPRGVAANQLAAGGSSHVMYFETGQGSALSAGAHHGCDQQTIEARAYAVARHFKPLLVNTVVGFIGPEYLFDGKQIIRAGLEDHFCGKLLGVPMGVDVCYTNHAEADSDDMDALLTLLCAAGCNFVMGIPGADDIMLNYQSTSFHDALVMRQVMGLRPAPEFEAWLQQTGIFEPGSGSRLAGTLPAPFAAVLQRLGAA